MVEKKLRHITVDEDNYAKLKSLGHAGDSFNDVITKILDSYFTFEWDNYAQRYRGKFVG